MKELILNSKVYFFLKDFCIWTIPKVFIELVTIFLFCVLILGGKILAPDQGSNSTVLKKTHHRKCGFTPPRFFFFLMTPSKAYQLCVSFQKANSWFHWLVLFWFLISDLKIFSLVYHFLCLLLSLTLCMVFPWFL